jgi:hypothetical protein
VYFPYATKILRETSTCRSALRAARFGFFARPPRTYVLG